MRQASVIAMLTVLLLAVLGATVVHVTRGEFEVVVRDIAALKNANAQLRVRVIALEALAKEPAAELKARQHSPEPEKSRAKRQVGEAVTLAELSIWPEYGKYTDAQKGAWRASKVGGQLTAPVLVRNVRHEGAGYVIHAEHWEGTAGGVCRHQLSIHTNDDKAIGLNAGEIIVVSGYIGDVLVYGHRGAGGFTIKYADEERKRHYQSGTKIAMNDASFSK